MEALKFSILLCSASLLLSSCAPEHPKDIERIDSLRAQAEALIKEQSLMAWNSWAFGTESNQDSLYKANANLFTLENIKLVQRAEDEEQNDVQKKRLRYFRRYLTIEYIDKEITVLKDGVSNIEAAATVRFEGRQIPYRQVAGLLANEKKQSHRAALYSAVDPVLDTLNIILTQVEQTNLRLARDLGYTSYNHMIGELKEIPLDEFKKVAEHILAETESTYTVLLDEIVGKQLRLNLDKFYRYDRALLLRSHQFDKYFPSSTMMDVLNATYTQLGINLNTQKNLKIDAEVREKKNPRAVCYAVEVPNDVRVSIKPIGGLGDYSALFHEMGHGQHYASTKEHAFEFKYLGEPTVTECFAFLSEYLLANQAWLRLNTSMPTRVLKEFIRFQAFHRLYFIRRYSAKFLYELQLHSGASNPQALYAELQSKAIGCKKIPSDEKRYLTDVDAHYYSAGYLRAWFLEAQLNAKLTKDFGVNWFEHPQAGEYLQSLWAKGDRLNGDEFVKVIGYERITPDVLLAAINTMILFSTKRAA
ncbi:MAG: M3 family metallopeptidase [Ignavibacteria bacterium]|nr:M3 family metallopeptidase [Ignavibacteria bacterium]